MTNEIAKIERGALPTIAPQNLNEVMQFSEMIAKSQIIPKALQGKPADIAVILMNGN